MPKNEQNVPTAAMEIQPSTGLIFVPRIQAIDIEPLRRVDPAKTKTPKKTHRRIVS